MENQVILEGTAKISPVAKPRPKFRVIKNKFTKNSAVMTYYPGDYSKWEEGLTLHLKSMVGRDLIAATGPVRLDATFFIPVPPSINGKERAERLAGWHDIKPDRDNLEKALCDALNHAGVWKDDCQVVDGRIQKKWAEVGCIEVKVTKL